MKSYIILAHSSVHSLFNLVGAIYNERDLFAIHLDLRASPEMHLAVSQLSCEHANILKVDSVLCSWGGFSLVQATLNSIRLLMSVSESWSHVILLSEQHYPLRDAKSIAAALEEGKSYMNAFNIMDYSREMQEDITHRFSRFFSEIEGVGCIGYAPRTDRIDHIFHGSQWIILSKQAALYVSDYFNSLDAISFFATSLLPDETAIQTVVMNAIEAQRGFVECSLKTFVATPSFTDNTSLVANRESFIAAQKTDALFIRKCPVPMSGLDEFVVKDDFSIHEKSHSTKVSANTSSEVARSKLLLTWFREGTSRLELNDCSDRFPSSRVLFFLSDQRWLGKIQICVMSQNLKDYAVIVCTTSAEFNYNPVQFGPYSSHRIKARLYGLFMHLQLDLPLRNHGVCRVMNPYYPKEVLDLVSEAEGFCWDLQHFL